MRLLKQRDQLDSATAQAAANQPASALAQALPLIVALDAFSLDEVLAEHPMDAGQRVFVCVSSQLFVESPHETMAAISSARKNGFTICLEVGGDDEHAIAFLALIEPDVVLTAPALLRTLLATEAARITHALAAHTERSHAVIIAEGVDDQATRAVAETIGAAYGIGALYPPQPTETLFAEPTVAFPPHPVWAAPEIGITTPYALATRDNTPRRGTKSLLVEMSKALETQASSIGASMIAIGTFQHRRHFTQRTSARWQMLSQTIGFAGIYGAEITPIREENIHKAALRPDDPLVDEWTVAILGPHFSALIAAKDLHDNGPDLERTFDFIQTFDRLTVVQAVRSILSRFD
ncbi:hypothetical protein TPAU25S_03384 [Tsukamurella paurometabola]|uniref:DICT sensory domain-containing protein n=1 Tax=Tsukamurella paurometabola TaxID=2061 RepID=UPI00019F07E7|nr:DICT sensory domain-containing protein [Tsukamurella paurometabola]SUP42276.1 Predicted sensor protein/domain [Tsukamurella paurometabola]